MKFRQPDLLWTSSKAAADAAANTNTTAQYFGAAPMEVTAIEAVFIPAATLTAHDTNYATLAINKGSTVIASITTKTAAGGGSGDFVAGTPVALAVKVDGDGDVAEDGAINWTITKAGTGVAVPIGTWQLYARGTHKLP